MVSQALQDHVSSTCDQPLLSSRLFFPGLQPAVGVEPEWAAILQRLGLAAQHTEWEDDFFLAEKQSLSYILTVLIFFTIGWHCWHWGSTEQSTVTPSILFQRTVLYPISLHRCCSYTSTCWTAASAVPVKLHPCGAEGLSVIHPVYLEFCYSLQVWYYVLIW